MVEEEVIAEAVLNYPTPLRAKLIRRRWDYTSKDIGAIETRVTGFNIDYLDYNINADGDVYFWQFGSSNSGTTFGSRDEAARRFESFEGAGEIRWISDDV